MKIIWRSAVILKLILQQLHLKRRLKIMITNYFNKLLNCERFFSWTEESVHSVCYQKCILCMKKCFIYIFFNLVLFASNLVHFSRKFWYNHEMTFVNPVTLTCCHGGCTPAAPHIMKHFMTTINGGPPPRGLPFIVVMKCITYFKYVLEALTRFVDRRAMMPSVTEMRVAKSHCGVHKGR